MATVESQVISAVCKNKDIHLILGEDPEVFGAHADVVGFMKDYYARHKAVPSAEVIEERFSTVDLIDVTAPTAYYLDKMKDDFVRARLESIISMTADRIDMGDASRSIVEKLQTKLARLARYSNSARDLNLTDAEDAAEHFIRLREKSDGGVPGISTGFDSIDCMYPTGMAPGHSIVLMGYTGRGKSFFSALLAVKAWQQGKKVMIVSLEMSPEEYRERVYAMMSSGLFKISDLARGDVNDDNFRTWSKKALADHPDFVVVSSEGIHDFTPNLIQAKIDVHRPDIVILDYLQLMNDNAKTGAMTPRMLNLSREIKLLAMSNAIPIVSITAVTDEDNDKRDSPPVLSQVAWSKAIEYDANVAIAVHRHDDSNLVEIVARKNRHGDLFGFFFDVDFDHGVWEERADAP